MPILFIFVQPSYEYHKCGSLSAVHACIHIRGTRTLYFCIGEAGLGMAVWEAEEGLS